MIEIEQRDSRRIECPTVSEDISTGGLGPCMGIFFYDPYSKVTFVGHYVSPHLHDSTELEKLVDAAVTEFRDKQDIKVYVSGCVLGEGEGEGESEAKRNHVEELLKKKCPNNFDVHLDWPVVGVHTVEMILEPTVGFYDCLKQST